MVKSMKKYLYHYFNLILSLLQAFICFHGFHALTKYTLETGLISIIIVAWWLPIGLSILIDTRIRKYSDWFMIALAVIVSPIRFIFQIATIVKFYKSGCSIEYSKRGGFITSNRKSWMNYVLFGYDNQEQTKEARGYKLGEIEHEDITDIIAKKAAAAGLGYSEYLSREHDPVRYNAIKEMAGGLDEATVKICSFINFQEGWEPFNFFHLGKYHRNAYITSLKVNGTEMISVKAIGTKKLTENLVGLALKPGRYTISMKYIIDIPATDLKGVSSIEGFENSTHSGVVTKEIVVTNTAKPMYVGLFVDINAHYEVFRIAGKLVVNNVRWSKSADIKLTTVEYYCKKQKYNTVSDNWGFLFISF